MGDEGEIWNKYRELNRQKKLNNTDKSLKLLKEKGFTYKILDGLTHIRVGGYDFWSSTGKFYNQKTKVKGRGVFNLIKKLQNEKA